MLERRVTKWRSRVGTRHTGEMCARHENNEGHHTAFLKRSALTVSAALDTQTGLQPVRRPRCCSAPLGARRRMRYFLNADETRKSEHGVTFVLTRATRHMWPTRVSRKGASSKCRAKNHVTPSAWTPYAWTSTCTVAPMCHDRDEIPVSLGNDGQPQS